MGTFDYLLALFEQTENLNERLSNVEVELKKIKLVLGDI